MHYHLRPRDGWMEGCSRRRPPASILCLGRAKSFTSASARGGGREGGREGRPALALAPCVHPFRVGHPLRVLYSRLRPSIRPTRISLYLLPPSLVVRGAAPPRGDRVSWCLLEWQRVASLSPGCSLLVPRTPIQVFRFCAASARRDRIRTLGLNVNSSLCLNIADAESTFLSAGTSLGKVGRRPIQGISSSFLLSYSHPIIIIRPRSDSETVA